MEADAGESGDIDYMGVGERADLDGLAHILEQGFVSEHACYSVLCGALDGGNIPFYRDLVYQYVFGADNAAIAAISRTQVELAIEMIEEAVGDPDTDIDALFEAGEAYHFPAIAIYATYAAEKWGLDPHAFVDAFEGAMRTEEELVAN